MSERPIADYTLDDPLWHQVRDDGERRFIAYCPPFPMIVLGRGSRPDVELHLNRVQEDDFPLYRRRGGGCAVVLDPGNLVLAACLPVEGIGETPAYFRSLNRWLLEGLESLGLSGLSQDGISDIVVGDRKVGGTCMYRPRGLLLYSASLLVSPELDLMDRYLAHPPREPEYRKGRAHREFVRPLSEVAPLPSMEEVRTTLELQLAVTFPELRLARES